MSLTLELDFSPMGFDAGSDSQSAWLVPDDLAARYATTTRLPTGQLAPVVVYDDRGWDRFLRMMAVAPGESGPSLARWLALGPVYVMAIPKLRVVAFGYPVESEDDARAWGCRSCRGYAVHVERLEHVPDLPACAEMDEVFDKTPGCRGRTALKAIRDWARDDLPLLVAADKLRAAQLAEQVGEQLDG